MAEHAARLHTELAQGLTPHHRLHSAGLQILVETLAGRWNAVQELTVEGERAVDANADTPCAQNVTTLLHLALASAYRGDEAEARRLEAKADAIGMMGYRPWFEPPRIRLALAHNDLMALPALVSGGYLQLEPPAAYLDALLALGDRDRIEEEAPKWLTPGIYAEPFALRALGKVRGDRALIDQALERFEVLQLPWHAEQTRHLL